MSTPSLPVAAQEASDCLEVAASQLPRGEALRLLGRLEEIRAAILLRLATEQQASVVALTPRTTAPRSAGRALTPKEVGKRLGLSADWVRDHLDEIGWIPVGRRRRVTERQLERYLASTSNPLA